MRFETGSKPKRPRIDHFLSHALTAQTGRETSLRELYAEYRLFARPKGKPRFATVEAELNALTRYAPIYETLENGGADAVGALGAKLNLWEVSTAYPLVFHIAASQGDEAVKEQLYTLLESYIVRRAFCGLTTKNYNKTFGRIIEIMLTQGMTLGAFASSFEGARGDAVRFPDDAELMAAMIARPIYQMIGRKERLSDLLWQLECAMRTKYHVNTPRPAQLSIEHILPQTWSTHWPLPDGRVVANEWVADGDEALLAALIRRRSLLHTIGNLTLVTVAANISASNGPFAAKANWLANSLLAMNLDITRLSSWDENAVETRSREMAATAALVWPAPQKKG